MFNESTSTASGSNSHDMLPKPEATEDLLRQYDSHFAAKLDTLSDRVVSFVEGQEKVKQALDAVNKKLVSVQAEGIDLLADIKTLREEFASMRNLRAGLPQTGDNQMLGDLGEPNATEERIASFLTQEDIMPGVGSSEGSEALEQLESTSARSEDRKRAAMKTTVFSSTSERQVRVDENGQGLDPKSVDIVANKVSEEKVPADDSTTSPPTCLPKTRDLQVTDKKEKKAVRNAEKKATKRAEEAAETARVEAEAQKKAELDRLVKININRSPEIETVIDFEEGRAKQFLIKRKRFHEGKRNLEVARLFSVMLDNMCPRIRKYAQQLFNESPGSLLTAELDLLVFLKGNAHSFDAFDCFKANNLERTQQYIQNFVQNYTNNQTAIRTGKAQFHGDVKSKKLSIYICAQAIMINAENLDWEHSKEFFETAAHCYRAVELYDGPIDKAFLAYAYGQLASQENTILKVDGHVMSELLKQYKEVEKKVAIVVQYMRLVFSVCTL